MRPGQQAPESAQLEYLLLVPCSASMRPGQQAPESVGAQRELLHVFAGFNEARAASPGIPGPRDNRFIGVDVLQ